MQAAATDATLSLLTLADIVGDRLERLPQGARRLAEVVALAGRPLPLAVFSAACGGGGASDDDVEQLRSERLVRTGFREGSEVIEPSHDRIRETIVEQIPAGDFAPITGLTGAEAASNVDLSASRPARERARERGAAFAETRGRSGNGKLAFDQAAPHRLASRRPARTTRAGARIELAGDQDRGSAPERPAST
jgi:hypothetical protein